MRSRLATKLRQSLYFRLTALRVGLIVLALFIVFLWTYSDAILFSAAFWSIDSNVKLITAFTELFRNVALGLGAIVAATIGIWFTARERRLGEARHRSERHNEFLRNAGSDSMILRTDAIQGLTQIARENPTAYNERVLDIFLRMLREKSDRRSPSPNSAAAHASAVATSHYRNGRPTVPEDVRLIVSKLPELIERQQKIDRSMGKTGRRLDFSNVQLGGIAFPVAMPLQHVRFVEADLSHSSLVSADLTGAIFSFANLSHANFGDSELFRQRDRDFISEEEEAQYGERKGAILRNCTMEGTNLTKANLSHSDLRDATFVDCELHGAGLLSARVANAKFFDVRGTDAYLWHSDFQNATFVRCDFHRTEEARKKQATFARSRLRDAEFHEVDLRGVNLALADCCGARFSAVDFKETNLFDTNISGAEFGTGISDKVEREAIEIRNLTNEQLCKAWAEPESPAKLPGWLDVSVVKKERQSPSWEKLWDV